MNEHLISEIKVGFAKNFKGLYYIQDKSGAIQLRYTPKYPENRIIADALAALIQIRSGKRTRINATGRMTLAELKQFIEQEQIIFENF